MAAHILLEETGVEYATVDVPIADKAHLSPRFLKINPKGRVPILHTPEGAISENPAILEYIAEAHPTFHLSDPFQKAQARALAAYLGATAHVAFAHWKRGGRWAALSDTRDDLRQRAPHNLAHCAEYLEAELHWSPWAVGPHYSFCDPYVFQFTRWLDATDVSLGKFPNLRVHQSAMIDRPATQRVLALHGLA